MIVLQGKHGLRQPSDNPWRFRRDHNFHRGRSASHPDLICPILRYCSYVHCGWLGWKRERPAGSTLKFLRGRGDTRVGLFCPRLVTSGSVQRHWLPIRTRWEPAGLQRGVFLPWWFGGGHHDFAGEHRCAGRHSQLFIRRGRWERCDVSQFPSFKTCENQGC